MLWISPKRVQRRTPESILSPDQVDALQNQSGLLNQGVAVRFNRDGHFVGDARKTEDPADRSWNLVRNDAARFSYHVEDRTPDFLVRLRLRRRTWPHIWPFPGLPSRGRCSVGFQNS